MGKLTLDEFSRAYVSTALIIAEREYCEERFYNELVETLFAIHKLPRELTLRMHHVFHWNFFCGDNGSPFEYALGGERHKDGGFSPNIIKLKKGKNADVEHIVAEIMRDYKNVLEAKFSLATSS